MAGLLNAKDYPPALAERLRFGKRQRNQVYNGEARPGVSEDDTPPRWSAKFSIALLRLVKQVDFPSTIHFEHDRRIDTRVL
jgi:hypothetical protein